MTRNSLNVLFTLLLAFCSYNVVAFAPARSSQKVAADEFVPSSRNGRTHLRVATTEDELTSSTQPSSLPPIESHLIVGCFGRLADKSFVVSPSDVEGTAASGYEFGVLESGRPKWICSYTSRTGATQGGGAPMTHIPTWCSLLFGDDNDSTLTKENLSAVLQSEDTKFEMPLGASPGAKKKAVLPFSDDDCKQVMNKLWEVLGGDNSKDEGELSKQDVVEGLSAVATKFGSKSDSMTYSVFEKAMKA